MDLQRYFERIGYTGDTEPTLETLTGLHVGHTFNIPFENLSPFYGEPISLDPDALFDKLVERERGGYCFEMNGFFAAVLQQLGFDIIYTLVRGNFKGEFGAKMHSVLIVKIDGKHYLADVGFGNDGIPAPLLITENEPQTCFGYTYRFTKDAKYEWVLERMESGSFLQMFALNIEPFLPMEFEIANHFTATYPQSFFKSMRFCTKPTETGRVTLTDRHYKIVEFGVATTDRETSDEAEFEQLMLDVFGLNLNTVQR